MYAPILILPSLDAYLITYVDLSRKTCPVDYCSIGGCLWTESNCHTISILLLCCHVSHRPVMSFRFPLCIQSVTTSCCLLFHGITNVSPMLSVLVNTVFQPLSTQTKSNLFPMILPHLHQLWLQKINRSKVLPNF